MQSANLSGPLKGLRPYQALIGPTQASGLAGGFDYRKGLAEFAPAGAKKLKSVFPGDMRVGENTAQAASVGFVRLKRRNPARSGLHPTRKSGFA